MWVAPGAMARVYALPRSDMLLRALAIRDTWVGVCLLSDGSAGGVARFASDLLDAVLMVRNARSQQRGLRSIRGRLLGAALSASSGLYAASGGVVTR